MQLERSAKRGRGTGNEVFLISLGTSIQPWPQLSRKKPLNVLMLQAINDLRSHHFKL